MPTIKTVHPTDETLASLSPKGQPGELTRFVRITPGEEGLFDFVITDEGGRLDAIYRRAFRIAEERGERDREVVRAMAELSAAWPSHPGVIEHDVNESLEANKTHEALQIAERATATWGAELVSNGIDSVTKLRPGTTAIPLLIQVLANFEFALERSDNLSRALAIAKLAIALDPSDPENLTSSVITLAIRSDNADEALAELYLTGDSTAPYVLYGRALAYYALHQFENAATAIQTALRFWPAVAQGIVRDWRGGVSLPKQGQTASDTQVLYGYYEVFGPAWKSVTGALDWLRTEEKKFALSGAKQQQYVGLTKTGHKTDGHGNILAPSLANQERLANATVVKEDAFCKLLTLGQNEYVYALTDLGKEQEAKHDAVFKEDLKYHDRIARLEALCQEWTGHANAAISLARFSVSDRKFEKAVDILERAIFKLQEFWPEDMIGNGKLEIDWEGNKSILTAYAHIVLDCAEGGEIDAARSFADDYIAINPRDNLGVRQKAIELALLQSDIPAALKIIDTATDTISAHNLFGRALALFAADRKSEATDALHAAVTSRPKIYHEMTSDKHRMPPNYNPTFVAYFSTEEAYNYWSLWSGIWRSTLGALAWLRKEGRVALQEPVAA